MLATLSPPRVSLRLPPAIQALAAILDQLADLLGTLDDDDYARKPVGVVPSSIGGHVRHCLDHVEALLSGLPHGLLDYDARRRDTAIERCRRSALAALAGLREELLGRSWPEMNRPLRMKLLLDASSAPVEVVSSLGRELSFVLSHTIHHNALVAVLVRLQGGEVPPRFGYAPSTVAHEEQRTCVR